MRRRTSVSTPMSKARASIRRCCPRTSIVVAATSDELALAWLKQWQPGTGAPHPVPRRRDGAPRAGRAVRARVARSARTSGSRSATSPMPRSRSRSSAAATRRWSAPMPCDASTGGWPRCAWRVRARHRPDDRPAHGAARVRARHRLHPRAGESGLEDPLERARGDRVLPPMAGLGRGHHAAERPPALRRGGDAVQRSTIRHRSCSTPSPRRSPRTGRRSAGTTSCRRATSRSSPRCIRRSAEVDALLRRPPAVAGSLLSPAYEPARKQRGTLSQNRTWRV